MIEVKYTPPRSIKHSRARVVCSKRAMLEPTVPTGTGLAAIETAATQLVKEYPLASVGIAAGAAFLLVRVKWLREAAMIAAIKGVRHYLQDLPPPK